MDFKEIDAKKKIKKVTQTARLTDVGNAELINEMFGNEIRFDHRRGRWLIWKGHRWQSDDDTLINRLAIKAARQRYLDVAKISDLEQRRAASKWAISSEFEGRVKAATSLAKSLLPIADKGADWDANPMLLSCTNGILDLKTGILRDGKPNDRITMICGTDFDPAAKCPLWDKFVSEIFENDSELISYVQKAAGYSLTGENREQLIFFGVGSGSNGKSTFFETIRTVLGQYAYNTPPGLFRKDSRSSSSNDSASIEFKRFLFQSEVLSADKLNEELMKKISGGDTMTARFLYKENFEFSPVCKIWLFVNHLPVVDDDSYAFWRRVRLIPFPHKFAGENADEFLVKKLKTELPGILNWLLAGCLLWQEEGLKQTPEVVAIATGEYQAENDTLYEFLQDTCVEGEGLEIKASSLYYAYTVWAKNNGLKGKDVSSNTDFGRKMNEKFSKKHREAGWFYKGIDYTELSKIYYENLKKAEAEGFLNGENFDSKRGYSS